MIPVFESGALTLGLVALLAYLLGSVPFGIVMARAFGLGDLRKIGSGNIGATNVLRTGNKTAAALTLILDAGKGGIAVLLAARSSAPRTRRRSRPSPPSSATAFRSSSASGAERAWRPSSARCSRWPGPWGSRPARPGS
jgi:hypothetical protein